MTKFPSSNELTLKDRLRFEEERINEEVKKAGKKRVWLFMAADYSNLGDQAITKATLHYFKKYFNLSLIEVPKTIQNEILIDIKELVNPNDLVFISGGGFLGSIWFECEKAVRDIVEAFPNNQIVILPQSIYWDPEAEEEKTKSARLYQQHGKIIFCARDKVSYREMKKTYPFARIKLLPDMVLSSDFSLFGQMSIEREGTLLVIRQDKESAMTEEDRENIRKWARKNYPPVKEIENHAESYRDILSWERDEELANLFMLYANAKLVVTDRLHGMIFSALAGTPCVAIDSATHKVKNTFKWIKNVKNIAVAKNASQVPKKAKKVLKVGPLSWKAQVEELDSFFSKMI